MTERGTGAARRPTSTDRRVGLLVPASDGMASAWGLPRRLAAHARTARTSLVPLVPGGPPHSCGAVVLLVAQYGPLLARDSAEVLRSDPAPWGDCAVGLVGYGGVDRARDALVEARDLLALDGHVAVTPSLGVNVAGFRSVGDLTSFERLAWHDLLDTLFERVDDLGHAGSPPA